jgi:hypothetical protein
MTLALCDLLVSVITYWHLGHQYSAAILHNVDKVEPSGQILILPISMRTGMLWWSDMAYQFMSAFILKWSILVKWGLLEPCVTCEIYIQFPVFFSLIYIDVVHVNLSKDLIYWKYLVMCFCTRMVYFPFPMARNISCLF